MTATPLMVNGQPNPTGTGSWCAPLRCYCRGCPGWAEQDAAAKRQYEIEVRRAKSQLAEKEAKRGGNR